MNTEVVRRMQVLVIANGEPSSRSLMTRLARNADLIVAADGGANVARAAGIRPDLVVGDLDSVSASTRRAFAGTPMVHIDRQDNTDLEKTLDYILERGFRRTMILGTMGRRVDFTLANVTILWGYSRRLKWMIGGDGWHAAPVGRKLTIRAPRGTVVSLVPFGRVDGITLRGLQYPMVNGTLGLGAVAVSNVVRASQCTITTKRGSLLAIVMTSPPDRLPGQ